MPKNYVKTILADIDDIQAGDWLYYVNDGYYEIERSVMFVDWLDKKQHWVDF